MSKDNPISTAAYAFRDATGSPLMAATLLGLIGYGGAKLFRGPAVETMRALGRPFGKMLAVSNEEWDMAMDDLKGGKGGERFPRVAGVLPFLATLAASYRPNERYGGLLSWNAPFVKNSSLESGYLPDIDFGRRIDAPSAMSLFSNDPNLQDSPYVRNFGTSIVSAAALGQHTNRPTLGGVFDSAVDKFNSKLSLGGIARTAVRTTVANAAARMFTGALGTMMELPDGMRDSLVSAGTWAGAISSILD